MSVGANISGAGSLLINASGAITVGTQLESVGPATLNSSSNSLTLSNSDLSTTGGGSSDITLNAATNLSVINTLVSSTGAMSLTAANGNLSIDSNSYLQFIGHDGGLTVNALNGSLVLAGGTAYDGDYPLFIHGTAGNGITVTGTVVSASGSTDGTKIGTGIQLTATGGNFVANDDLQSAGGDIALAANAGMMTLSGELTSAGKIVLSAQGNIVLNSNPTQSAGATTVTSTSGTVTVNNINLDTTGAGASVSLNAVSGVTITSSSVALNGSLSVTTSAGDIDLDPSSTYQFLGAQGGLTLTAHDGGISLGANSLGFQGNAPTFINATADHAITVTTGLNTTPAAGNASAAGGSISLIAGTDLTLGTVSTSATGGSFSSAGPSTLGRGGAIILQASGVVTLNGGVNYAFGGNNTGGGPGGNGGSITIASTGTSASQTSVSMTGGEYLTNNGNNGNGALGTGGTINISSADASTPAANGAPAILVDSAVIIASDDDSVGNGTASVNGGTINITSARTGGQGITEQDSSQLLALADVTTQTSPVPIPAAVNLTTSGADITVSGGSTIRTSGANSAVTLNTGTSGGTINVSGFSSLTTTSPDSSTAPGSTVALNTQNSLPTQTSAINLTDAILTADVLKIQALGTSGHITIGGSTTLTGNSQLILYAGDSTTHIGGMIEFVSNTTLNSNVAGILAAHTIQIDGAQTVVTVNSAVPLQVYGDVLNYSAANGGDGLAGYGSFSGSGAPTAAAGTFVGLQTAAPAAIRTGKASVFRAAGGYYILRLHSPFMKPTRAADTAYGAPRRGRASGSANLTARNRIDQAANPSRSRQPAAPGSSAAASPDSRVPSPQQPWRR
jgi:hypothetical protein